MTKDKQIDFVLSEGPEKVWIYTYDDGSIKAYTGVFTLATPADIDALIAALRAARDVLAPEPRDGAVVLWSDNDPMRDLIEPIPQRDETERETLNVGPFGGLGLYDPALDAPPAAPEPTANAPRVRLTRAQREALALLAQDGYYMSRPSMFDKSDVHHITDGRGGDYLKVRSATVTALYKAKLIASKESFDEYRITKRGRAALRDAGTRDARNAGGEMRGT